MSPHRTTLLRVLGLFLLMTLTAQYAAAGLLNESATGYNSRTFGNNLQDIIYSSTNNYLTNTRFNTTQTFTGGDCGSSKTCLWIPWMTSSSACTTAELHTTSGMCASSLDLNNNALVTDEF